MWFGAALRATTVPLYSKKKKKKKGMDPVYLLLIKYLMDGLEI